MCAIAYANTSNKFQLSFSEHLIWSWAVVDQHTFRSTCTTSLNCHQEG